jgi:hypothetical protein
MFEYRIKGYSWYKTMKAEGQSSDLWISGVRQSGASVLNTARLK